MTIELDDLDDQILAVLEKDGRTPASQIADQIGLSRPAVAERISKLEAGGVIEGITAIVSPVALGRSVTAFISAHYSGAMDRSLSKAFRKFMARPEVEEAHAVAGEDCFLLKVRADSISSLNVIVNELSAEPFSMTTRTTIVLDSFCEKHGGVVRWGSEPK